MKKTLTMLLFLPLLAMAQPGSSDLRSDQMQAAGYFWKLSAIFSLHGGTHLSTSLGIWYNHFDLQPSLNTSFNLLLGPQNFGCRQVFRQRMKGTIVFSPLLLVRCGGASARVAEVNPFYLGNSSGILNNYRSFAAIGTSFVAAPKGVGKNIITARNRSQQLIYLGGKVGWDSNYVMLNLYEDFFAFTDDYLQGLADNRDRYYTGGGNIQICVNNHWLLKYYTETYTGNSYPDHIQYPDLVYPFRYVGNDCMPWRFFSGPRRMLRHAYQDPGQVSFNQGRDIISLEYSGPINGHSQQDINNQPHSGRLMVLMGWQGYKNNMWQQNLVHNAIKVDKYTGIPASEGNPKAVERYRRFMPRSANQEFDTDLQGNKVRYKKKCVIGLGYGYGIQ